VEVDQVRNLPPSVVVLVGCLLTALTLLVLPALRQVWQDFDAEKNTLSPSWLWQQA